MQILMFARNAFGKAKLLKVFAYKNIYLLLWASASHYLR
jgi:hypothetical protein